MKIYVHNDEHFHELASEVIHGKLAKVTLHISSKPYACIEVWGSYIELVEHIKALGCTEYQFPEKGK